GEVTDVRARSGAAEREVEFAAAAVRFEAGDAVEREDVRVVFARGHGDRHAGDVDDVLGFVAVPADGEAAVDVHAVEVRPRAGRGRAARQQAAAAAVERERVAVDVDRADVLAQRRL